MKSYLLIITVVAAFATSATQAADQLKSAVVCSGAATLNNGSVVCIGQPFVGVMRAADNSVTIQTGFLTGIGTNTFPVTPLVPVQIQPSQNLVNGRFQMSFSTTLGNSYVVQASTNLMNWIPIWTNVATSSSVLFEDPDTAIYRHRFYRVVAP